MGTSSYLAECVEAYGPLVKGNVYRIRSAGTLYCEVINHDGRPLFQTAFLTSRFRPFKETQLTASPSATAPAYYKDLKPEPLEVIDGWELGFNLGNTVKYISRAGRKTTDAVEDLEKAAVYLTREIAHRKKQKES